MPAQVARSPVALVEPIQYEDVEVDVEIQRTSEALNHRDAAGPPVLQRHPDALVGGPSPDFRERDAQDSPRQLRPAGEQPAAWPWHRHHPLPHRHPRQQLPVPSCGRFRHPPPATRWTEPTALAREGDQAMVVAPSAGQPGEASSRVSTYEEAIQLTAHKARQGRAAQIQMCAQGGESICNDLLEPSASPVA